MGRAQLDLHQVQDRLNLIAHCEGGMCLNLTLEDVMNQRVSLLVSALFVKVAHQPQLNLRTRETDDPAAQHNPG